MKRDRWYYALVILVAWSFIMVWLGYGLAAP